MAVLWKTDYEVVVRVADVSLRLFFQESDVIGLVILDIDSEAFGPVPEADDFRAFKYDVDVYECIMHLKRSVLDLLGFVDGYGTPYIAFFDDVPAFWKGVKVVTPDELMHFSE